MGRNSVKIVLPPLWKWIYSKRKQCTKLGSFFIMISQKQTNVVMVTKLLGGKTKLVVERHLRKMPVLFQWIHTGLLEMHFRNSYFKINCIAVQSYTATDGHKYHTTEFNPRNTTQQTYNFKTTSQQRRCNVMTLHRRCGDVIWTSCARWIQSPFIMLFIYSLSYCAHVAGTYWEKIWSVFLFVFFFLNT